MSENRIIGRDYEQHILQNICGEDEARLVAVYGRRRVGKLFFLRTFKLNDMMDKTVNITGLRQDSDRVLAGFSHTLALLMSKLRSRQETGKLKFIIRYLCSELPGGMRVYYQLSEI